MVILIHFRQVRHLCRIDVPFAIIHFGSSFSNGCRVAHDGHTALDSYRCKTPPDMLTDFIIAHFLHGLLSALQYQ